jgi:hypothetical protein
MKSSLFIYLYIAWCFCISVQGILTGDRKVFVYDNAGYHLYLPAVFIYQDLGTLSFYPSIDSAYAPSGDIKWYSIYAQPTGNKLNKYAIGNSIFDLPFFLCAHAYTSIAGQYPADGYSLPYQLAAAISYILWSLLALLLLKRFLSYYYTDSIVLAAIAAIALGTSYYYQLTMGGGSHIYAFLLSSAMLYYTHKWHNTYLNKYLYRISAIAGLILILRPADAVIIFLPLLWGISNKASLLQKLRLFKRSNGAIFLATIIGFAIAMLQMSYWKYTTGHWVYFSYEGESFNFLHPHITEGLFSYRKGWFLYTPLALIAFTGFYFLWKQRRELVPALFITIAAAMYIVFSWKNWWYGGGFASRAMVDFLPLLALPLAALMQHIASVKKIVLKAVVVMVFLLLITLHLFQTWQYTQGIIHYDRMNKAYYWHVFGKTSYTQEDLQYLMSDKEYWDAMREAYD